LANWKNFRGGDFHLTTPSKPRFRTKCRNGFWISALTV
jgi:hypothetical protein